MPPDDPTVEAPAESEDVEVMVCELAHHNIGFMLTGDATDDGTFVCLVFGL